MTVEFLAMAIIMAMLIVFAVLLLRSLTSSANVRIRADMLSLLSAYDKLIDKKSKEVRRLDRELEKHRAETSAYAEAVPVQTQAQTQTQAQAREFLTPGAAQLLSPPNYRLPEMKASYEAIRDSFSGFADRQASLLSSVRQTEAGRSLRGSDAGRLAGAMSFDTVYALSLMEPAEQLDLLRESLESGDMALLEDYLTETEESAFSVSRFWTWLKSLSQLESSGITVRCGDETACRNGDMEYSQDIFEGIQIRAGNHLYDYSIGEREIG